MYLRVDDRLVHGQVVTAWVKQLKTKRIIVVDNEAAENKFVAKALKLAAPVGIDLRVVTVDRIAGALTKDTPYILVIAKYPVVAEKIVRSNPEVAWNVNIGNVGSAEGRETYADTVHLDEDNFAAVKAMRNLPNVDVYMQTVPGQPVNRFPNE